MTEDDYTDRAALISAPFPPRAYAPIWAVALETIVREQGARIADLEARLARSEEPSCIVCEAVLVPDDYPPHCHDCIVTDEHEWRWRDERQG